MRTGIIILGVGRSGTSLLAEVVARWGAYGGGDAQLTRADAWNPHGYWEYRPLRQFNKMLMSSVGASQGLPPSDNTVVKERASDPEYREQALRLLAEMQAGGAVWFWKDPLLSFLLPFWKTIWKRVVYVVPVRNPLDISLSQQQLVEQRMRAKVPLDHFPISATLLYWQYSMLTILKDTEKNRNKIFIEYERLLSDPAVECERLCAFLDQKCGIYKDRRNRTTNMVKAIDPQIRRNKTSVPFSRLDIATPEQKQLYRFLQRKAANPNEKFERSAFPLYSGWRDYLQCLNALILAHNAELIAP
jgi:hypothetical protein